MCFLNKLINTKKFYVYVACITHTLGRKVLQRIEKTSLLQNVHLCNIGSLILQYRKGYKVQRLLPKSRIVNIADLIESLQKKIRFLGQLK